MKKKQAPLRAASMTWATSVLPDGTLVVPPPSNPMAVARRFVEALYMLPGGRLILRTHRGDFFAWTGTHYGEITRADVHARAYAFVEHAVYLHPEKGPLPFAPTQRKIADLFDALKGITHVESRPDAPLWIDRRDEPAITDTIAMTNGLLDVRTRILHPHTPLFFNHHALPFAFDPKANNFVITLALQADGKILVGGGFSTLTPNGGTSVTRNCVARLNLDGTVDTAFDPNAPDGVSTVSIQADGKILIGGNFTSVGGQSRNLFARLANDTAAVQKLTVTPPSIFWERSGAAPQLSRVIFERSSDGINYTFLGNGTRIGATNTFALFGQNLPLQQILYVRARGFYRGSIWPDRNRSWNRCVTLSCCHLCIPTSFSNRQTLPLAAPSHRQSPFRSSTLRTIR